MSAAYRAVGITKNSKDHKNTKKSNLSFLLLASFVVL